MKRIVYYLLCSAILNNVSGVNNLGFSSPGVPLWAPPPQSLASVTSTVTPDPTSSASPFLLPVSPALPTSPNSPTPSLTSPPTLPLPTPSILPALPSPVPQAIPTLPTNVTLDPASLQLLDFGLQHPRPIGVLTTSAGKPVEVRESVTLNTDVFNNEYFYDTQTGVDQERIPERVVHAKGCGAFGYFEVTNDVSKFTKAEVFNGIGKRTPIAARFSLVVQNQGGNDLTRETRSLSFKFYTNEGNLDLIGLNSPVFLYRSPSLFQTLSHCFHRNPKTNLYDATLRVEMLTLEPDTIHNVLWLLSDFGQTNGYRKFDAFPIHTFEVNNKHGESFFVRFSFRSEQGTEYLTEESARILGALDADYSVRDLYNAIALGNYPSWRLEMDVMTKENITKLNYNPFDVTRLWENGTYQTVPVGRMVLNRNPDNFFRDVEQSAYNPGNLVPGIPGPPDDMFRARRLAYRDTQNYRLGINHNNIDVNRPKYSKVYNRDGVPPARDNMRDVPNYYGNSFNGPVPHVDIAKPRQRLMVYDRTAVDLQPPADFYNKFVTSEGGRNRLATNIAGIVVNALPFLQDRVVKILNLIDRDLGRRVTLALTAARVLKASPTVFVAIDDNPRVVEAIPNPIPSGGSG